MSIDESKYLEDRKGRLVLIDNVDPYDLEMDAFVKKQVYEALKLQQAIIQFKENTFDDCYACLALLAEKFNRKPGGQKGNVTFSSFDGSQQISISVQDSIEFGPELQVAKDIIDECLSDWSQGASEHLKAIVNDAFAVDQEGKLNIGRILSLRRHKIDDERWKNAMEAISESIRVGTSKKYLYFRMKDSSGKLINIPLNIAAL